MRSDRPDLRASGCAFAVASSRLCDASEMYGPTTKKNIAKKKERKVTLEWRQGMNHTDVRGRKGFSLEQKQNRLTVQIKHALFQRLSG